MKRFAVFLTVLLLVLFGAALTSPARAADGDYRISVFETSDLHGTIADTSAENHQYRLAWIADKIDDARQGREDSVVLLDGGDIYQGNTLSNLLDGDPLSAAFAQMGYDAVTIGNHEFDWDISNTVDEDGTMKDFLRDDVWESNEIPVVISNLYLNGDRAFFTNDYVILEKTARSSAGGSLSVRIGVVGFAENYASGILYSRFTGAGYTIEEDYDALEALAAELKGSGQCDAVILLAHSDAGVLSAKLRPDTAFDLVLGGHSHEMQAGETDGGLTYLEPAPNGEAYAYAELVFAADAEGKPVFDRTENARTVSVTENPALLLPGGENAEELDAAVTKITEEAIARLQSILDEKIGYITVPALRVRYSTNVRVISRESTCGNWMASIYARAVGAEIAFVNGGGIREDFTPEPGKDVRDITVSDIYAMFPFGNIIYCYRISYQELLTLLQYTLTYEGGALFSVVTGIDVRFTGLTVNEIVKDGETLYADGEWKIDPESTVTVAVNNYVSTTNRISDEASGSLENPLCAWRNTDRLISGDQTDNEAALRILREEAAANGGLLTVDEKTHYIEQEQPADAAAEKPAGPLPSGGSESYVVRRGDCLWMISRRFYGSGKLYRVIAEANGIADPDLIFPDQTLLIPIV